MTADPKVVVSPVFFWTVKSSEFANVSPVVVYTTVVLPPFEAGAYSLVVGLWHAKRLIAKIRK